MDARANEEKVLIRISFLTQYIIDKFKHFPTDIEPDDITGYTVKYYDKTSDKSVVISVAENLSCHMSLMDRRTGNELLSKEFTDYNCIDEVFKILRITAATNTNEGNPECITTS